MTEPHNNPEQTPDAALLLEFVRSGSEPAFQSLVEKYAGMLIGIARRQTSNSELAEEIVQNVFAIFARKAARLKATPTLAGWLYRTTMIECTATLRKERARKERMKQISAETIVGLDGDNVWREAMPLLDEAMEALSPGDRDIVLMRFWERKSFKEIGRANGKSEDASQKQTERALHKLSSALNRKGISITVGALAAGIPVQLATAVPLSLVTAITQDALASASTLSTGTLILKSIQAMTYAKTKTALAVAVAAAVPMTMQWNANNDLRTQLTHLESQLEQARSVSVKPTSRVPAATPAQPVQSVGQAQSTVDPQPPALPTTPADMVAEWRRALSERDPVKRLFWISRLLEGVNAETAPVIAAAFEQARKSGARFDKEYEAFMRTWARLDGQAAVAQAVKEAGGAAGKPGVLAAVAGWADSDPAAARSWIEQLPDNQAKEDLIVALLDGWSTADIDAASRYAESRPRTPARNRMRQLLMERVLMDGGIEAARTWFNDIDGEGQNRPYKQLAFDELINRMLTTDPSTAATWIKEKEGEPFLGGRAIRDVARQLADSNPTEALEWVGKLKEIKPGQRTSSYSQVMSTWAKQDPSAAGAWLNQNTGHTRYDSMVNRYILTISDIVPETAMQWAQSIGDENRRQISTLIAGAGLLAQKGEAAIPQLKAAGFTPEMIAAAPQRRAFALANSNSESAQRTLLSESPKLPAAP